MINRLNSFVFLIVLLFSSTISAATVDLSATAVKKGDSIQVTWSGFSGNVNLVLERAGSFWVHPVVNVSGSGSWTLDTGAQVNGQPWQTRNDYSIKVELRANPIVYAYSSNFSVSNPSANLSRVAVVRGDSIQVTWSGFSGNVNLVLERAGSFWVHPVVNVSGSGSWTLDTGAQVNGQPWQTRNDYSIKVELRANPSIYTNPINFSVDTEAVACSELKLTSLKILDSSGRNEINLDKVHYANPLTVLIQARTVCGNPNVIDTIPITLRYNYTGRIDTIELRETGLNTNIYNGTVVLNPETGSELSSAVVETAFHGDGEKFITYGKNGAQRGKAHSYGKESWAGNPPSPPATISAMNAAGYEAISVTTNITRLLSVNFPTIFIKCTAKWFMYSGDGYSDSLCPKNPGFVDMFGDDRQGCDQIEEERCYPSNILDKAWAGVDLVIFAACSVFNEQKPYGRAWFSKEGPRYFLGYADGAPREQGVEIIEEWKKLVDAGNNKAEAWMRANAAKLAWNASAYDKEASRYYYFLLKQMVYNTLIVNLKQKKQFSGSIGLNQTNVHQDSISPDVLRDSKNDSSDVYQIILYLQSNQEGLLFVVKTPSGKVIDIGSVDTSENIYQNKLVGYSEDGSRVIYMIENIEPGNWKYEIFNNLYENTEYDLYVELTKFSSPNPTPPPSENNDSGGGGCFIYSTYIP